MSRNKKLLLFSTIISLFAVFVCSISTAAWFQLDSQPLQTSLVTGTGSISLEANSTYGYKINPILGGDGQIDYSNNTVTKKNGSSISTTNNNLDGIDIDFDVPDNGIGYYLVEQNGENNFTYTYNSTLMATKFVSRTGGSVNTHYIAEKELAAKKYRVKKYTFVNNKTIYQQVPIKTSNNEGTEITLDATGDKATYDITVNTPGTYKIWLNYSSATDKWDLSLEPTSYSINGLNRKSIRAPKPRSAAVSGNTSDNAFLVFDVSAYVNWGGDFRDWMLGYWGSDGGPDSNNTWVSLGTSYYAAVPSNVTGGIIQFYQNNAVKNGLFAFPSLTAGSFYKITLSGVQNDDWYYRYNESGSKDGFDVGSVSPSDLSPTQLTIYCDTDWLTTWEGTVTNPQIAVFNNTSNVLLSLPGNSGNMTGNIGEICSYTFSYYGNKPQVQFRCSETINNNPETKYSEDLYLPDVSDGDKLYIIFSEEWEAGKMKVTISKQSSASESNYTVYLFDPLGYKNSATFYCYAWNSGASVNPYFNASFPGTAFTAEGSVSNLYQATFSQSYDNIIISDGTNRMAKVSVSNAQGKYLVLNYIDNYTDGTSNRFSRASWYASIAAVPTGSGNETTYFVYNKGGQLGASAPKAYAWTENDHEDFAGTYYYQYQNAAWPGVNTVQGQVNSTDIAGLYSISVPNVYDHIIFANSSDTNIQTANLTINSSTPYFIFDGTSTTTDGVTRYGGSWQASLAAITLKTLFFTTTDGSTYTELDTTNLTGLTTELGRDATEGGGTYTPSSVANQDGKDAINGILYHFVAEETYWYTSNSTFDNLTKFTPGSTTLAAGAIILYKRMICDLRNMTTLYVDVSHSGQGTAETYWQNISICGSGGNDTPYFSSNDSKANWRIGTNLYRFTVPSSYTIRVAKYGSSSSGGNNTSSNFSASSLSSNFIVIESAASGSNCGVVPCSDLATNIGTATIYVSTDGGSTFPASYTMKIGDQSSNDFVWERGIQIAVNSIIYVEVIESDGKTHNYYKYANYIRDVPTYIADDGTDNRNIKMTSYTGTARFNFYLTHATNPKDRKLSIAMVPDWGNGYYIIPYRSSLGTTTYSDAIKMSSGSKVSASYSGYYAAAGSEIFIRSYIDAVDTLYTAQTSLATGVYLGTSNGTTPTAPGVLHFTNAGYYDIQVYNGSITVTSYSVNDFFKLNPLNTSSVSERNDIKNQKTSLVIEVAFKCNNTYASKMTLTADNGMEPFVGAALYCTDADGKAEMGDPYTYLRTNHYSDISPTSNVINDSSTLTIPANSGATYYYAFILVDYLPTEVAGANAYDNFLRDCGKNIHFYLNAVQYIAS